jgi:phosphoglycolate phosphatase-like HAD superfamily hydrolase
MSQTIRVLPDARRHWIFDLDGTLTAAVHDFEALRAELGLPSGMPILEEVQRRSPADRARLMKRIAGWERDLAEQARAEPDAVALLEHLTGRGARVGVLTRNTAAFARRSSQRALFGSLRPRRRLHKRGRQRRKDGL